MDRVPPRQQVQQRPRILAVDPGERRTGIAVSDELGLYAHPRPAIVAKDQAGIESAIARVVEAEGVGEVVVGLPLSLSGQESAQTAKSRVLAKALQGRLAVPVSVWDERLSSAEAARRVPSRKHRTGELDSEAASIILQAVLDSRRGAVTR